MTPHTGPTSTVMAGFPLRAGNWTVPWWFLLPYNYTSSSSTLINLITARGDTLLTTILLRTLLLSVPFTPGYKSDCIRLLETCSTKA